MVVTKSLTPKLRVRAWPEVITNMLRIASRNGNIEAAEVIIQIGLITEFPISQDGPERESLVLMEILPDPREDMLNTIGEALEWLRADAEQEFADKISNLETLGSTLTDRKKALREEMQQEQKQGAEGNSELLTHDRTPGHGSY